jgi:hypothetical protein
MCSERISNTRPSAASSSSTASVSASQRRDVAANTSPRRLEAVSSGPNRRKLSEFLAITSRRNEPRTRVDSTNSTPGASTPTA